MKMAEVDTSASLRDRIITVSRRHHRDSSAALMEVFGKWCDFCGETDWVVLQLDHIMPVGQGAERKASLRSAVLDRLRSGRESPFNLHLLCANCHQRKTKIEAARPLPRIAINHRHPRGVRRCLTCKVSLGSPGREVDQTHYCRSCWWLRNHGDGVRRDQAFNAEHRATRAQENAAREATNVEGG